MPLFERIMNVFSAIVLTTVPILGLILGYEEKIVIIILLLGMLFYCAVTYFNVFKTYICLDIENKKLIIRESGVLYAIEIDTDDIIDLQVSDGVKHKDWFTIDINYISGRTKKITSWSHHHTRLAVFKVYERQTSRLKKFCYECNQVLSKKEEF